MLSFARGLILFLAALVAIVSALSAIESNEWWIRIWDFPRMQILATGTVLIIAALVVNHRHRIAISMVLGVACAWQLYCIYPYTPFVPTEVAMVDKKLSNSASCFSALSLNVYQDNLDYARTERLIARENPDLLILLETDDRWAQALKRRLDDYPAVAARVLNNTYGMIVATRLKARRMSVQVLTEPGTPSVFAFLETREGTPFKFVALHPRPPNPANDTEERDAEIAIAARLAARTPGATLAIGDFNDVAWSHTSQLFKRIGGYLDPRVGRAPYATFPAGWPLLRWPLDHVFISPEFVVRSVRVLGDVGSDHLPIATNVCLAPAAGRSLNDAPAAPDDADQEDTRQILREYQEDTREDAEERTKGKN